MPFTYGVDAELQVVYVAASGKITADDYLDLVRRVAAELALVKESTLDWLIDLSDAEVPGAEAIRGAARIDSEHPELFDNGARRAIVAPSRTLFGMARMYSLSAEGGPDSIRATRSLDEAKSWLGLPDSWDPSAVAAWRPA